MQLRLLSLLLDGEKFEGQIRPKSFEITGEYRPVSNL